MDPAAHALLQSLLSSGGLLSGDASRLLSASLQGMIPQHSSNASHTMPPQQLVATQIQQQQQALQLQQLRQVLLMEQQRSQAALAALRGGSGPAKAAAAGHVGGAENAAMQQHQHHHHHHHQQQQQQQQQAPIVLTPLAPLELPTWTVPEDPTSDAVLGPVDEAQFALPRPSFERLFGHQRDGVAWMYGLYRERTGGILGDDMGMGKTLQACTLLAGLFHTRRIRRALIVAPVSVVESWHRELQKAFAALPEDQPIVIHAISSSLTKQRRGTLLREVAAFGQDDASSSAAASGRRRAAGRSRAAAAEVQPIGVVVISTYQLVANAVDQFSFGCASGLGGSDEPDDEAASEEGEEAAGPAASADSAPHGNRWDYVILDEGHTIKNPKAKTTIAMEQLPSSQRLLLTGTPIHNNLADLHTLISWCTGGRLLGTKEHFQTNFMRPIEQGADRNATTRVKEFSAHKARELWSVIRPHLLQRSKNTTVEVQRHLPTKIELALWPCLSEVQVSVYNEFLVTKGFASMARDSPFPLEAIAHLRTICRHPLLIEFLRRKQAWARFQSLRRHVASMRNRMGRATEVDLDFLHIGERARSADFDDEDDNADLRDGESADTDEASVNEEFARFSPEDAETELGRQARELLLFTPLLRPAYGASARAKPARRSRRQAASSRSGKSGKSGNESDDDVAGLMQKLSVKDKAPHRGPSRRVVMDSDDDDDSYRANSEGGEGESESESEEDEEGAGAGDDGDAELAEWLADSASPSEVEGIVSAIHSKPFFKTMDTGRLASALGSMLERVGQAPIASRGSSSRERVVSAILQQSHKLKLARELIMAAVDGGHRVLLFSQSRQMLDILEFVLLHASAGSSGVEGRSLLAENVSRLDGSVAGKERQRIMDAFNDGERAEREEGAAGAASQGASAVTRRRARAAAAGASMVMRGPRVCLLTTKACGYGITLTGADRVIVFDPSWNPAEDRQAVDRAFRIGQTRAVVVYRMITAAVIEERIYGKQVFKDAVRCTVLDDHTTTSGHGVTVQSAAQRRAAKTQERNYFSRDEIRKLFVVENFSRSTVLDRLVEIHGENATVTEASMPEIDDSVGAWASGWMHGNAVLGVSRHDKLFAPPPVEAPEATSSSKARASSAAAAAAEAGAASAPAPALGLIPKKKAAVPADVLGAAPTVPAVAPVPAVVPAVATPAAVASGGLIPKKKPSTPEAPAPAPTPVPAAAPAAAPVAAPAKVPATPPPLLPKKGATPRRRIIMDDDEDVEEGTEAVTAAPASAPVPAPASSATAVATPKRRQTLTLPVSQPKALAFAGAAAVAADSEPIESIHEAHTSSRRETLVLKKKGAAPSSSLQEGSEEESEGDDEVEELAGAVGRSMAITAPVAAAAPPTPVPQARVRPVLRPLGELSPEQQQEYRKRVSDGAVGLISTARLLSAPVIDSAAPGPRQVEAALRILLRCPLPAPPAVIDAAFASLGHLLQAVEMCDEQQSLHTMMEATSRVCAERLRS